MIEIEYLLTIKLTKLIDWAFVLVVFADMSDGASLSSVNTSDILIGAKSDSSSIVTASLFPSTQTLSKVSEDTISFTNSTSTGTSELLAGFKSDTTSSSAATSQLFPSSTRLDSEEVPDSESTKDTVVSLSSKLPLKGEGFAPKVSIIIHLQAQCKFHCFHSRYRQCKFYRYR